MNVSPELEQKVRYYLDKFPDIEYSGTLFYTVEGSFENDDLVINAFDFLLQDIGTSGYTEFYQSPDVIHYMVEHPELLDENVYQGLMHSHHRLGAFFSGKDISTLRIEGSDRVHFVSLIIDTVGNYKAAITRLVREEMQATGFIKYPTFNNREISGSPITYTFIKEKVEYFMLDVTRPVLDNPFEELSTRIKEVQEQKSKVAKDKSTTTVYGNGYNSYGQYSWGKDKPATPVNNVISYQTNVGKGNLATPVNKEYVPTIIDDSIPFEEPDADTPPPYGFVKVDPEIIKDLVAQLLTGDIAYYYNNTPLDELARTGSDLFKDRFTNDNLFHAWAEQYVEFLVYYTEDPKLIMYDDETLAALVAHDMSEVLNQLSVKDKYVIDFINILNRYII